MRIALKTFVIVSAALVLLGSLTSSFAQSAIEIPVSPAAGPASQAADSSAQTQARSREDWSVISIQSMDFESRSATVTEHDAGPKFNRDLVRVQWRSGDSMELFVFTPVGVKRAPAILYLYTYPSDVDRFFNEGWATRATANGFAAVGFVSALTGQRFRNRPMKEWFVSELQESLGASTHDVQMILNYLDSRGDIDMQRIGMFGQGSGGAIAVLAAAADPRIKALDLLDPWGDWADWLKQSKQIPEEERPRYNTAEFLKRVGTLDPVTYLPALKDRSLRVQQILTDPAVPIAAMDKLAAAAPSQDDVVRYADAAAHYDATHAAGVSGWLKDRLNALPAHASE